MKKLTLTLFLITTVTIIVAQPILNTTNFVPNIGDAQLFYIADTNSIVDPTIGPNVTFDYSTMNSYGATQTQYVIDPSTTIYSSYFPTATNADTTGGVPINKNYSKVELTDSTTNIGLVVDINTYGTVTVQYNQDPETLMKFPFNYGNNYSDNYSGLFTIQSSGTTTNGNGTATVTADAWGTLLLPFGVSIDSVLRVKTVENLITDTIFIVFPPITILPIEVSGEYINYYKPSISKFPLLSFISGSYTQDNNQIDSSRTILSQYPMNVVGMDDLNKTKINYSVFPNPTNKSYTTLSFNLGESSFVKVELTNNLGQNVAGIFNGNMQQGATSLKIKTSNLSKGLYFININVDNRISTKKLIIE